MVMMGVNAGSVFFTQGTPMRFEMSPQTVDYGDRIFAGQGKRSTSLAAGGAQARLESARWRMISAGREEVVEDRKGSVCASHV